MSQPKHKAHKCHSIIWYITNKFHSILWYITHKCHSIQWYITHKCTGRHRHCERKSDIDLKIKNVQNEVRTRPSVSYGTDFGVKRSKTKISEPRFSEILGQGTTELNKTKKEQNDKFYRGAKTLGEKGQIFPPNRDSMVDTIPNPRKL